MRIGLLGGSFNPAHIGHAHVARAMRIRLNLDQVWLLVSPGNPLKPRDGMAPLSTRLASAVAIADGRRLLATDLEARLGTRFSADTMGELRQRFPNVAFVWLMGADAFAELPRWCRWQDFARLVPIAVHARAPFDRPALAGRAARSLPRRPLRAGRLLAGSAPPGWLFLPLARRSESATALRAANLGFNTPPSDAPGATR